MTDLSWLKALPFSPEESNFILVLIGLLLLFVGGDRLIKGAVSIAEKLRLSKLLIGLTIVGMGTSAPELLVSLQSAQMGNPDMALGNIVGSNIANILLILGISLTIAPVKNLEKGVRRDTIFMIMASVSLLILGYFIKSGTIGIISGTSMILALMVYLIVVYFQEKRKSSEKSEQSEDKTPLLMSLLWVTLGLIFLVVGANALVTGATGLAKQIGISDAVIGLTLVAVGTSLPELTVAILASIRRESAVSLGNLIGSNIFNILGILGTVAVISPIKISSEMMSRDIPIMVLIAIVLGLIVLIRKKLDRVTGLIFMGAYGIYLSALF
jgi:cation:H+ antiporter